jgi:hypothetical protein
MRTREELFEMWADPARTWSPWVKPVVFTWLTATQLSLSDREQADVPQLAAFPDASSGTAIVLELTGPTALRFGVALAGRGYQPVPLFNGVPDAGGAFISTESVGRLLVALADDVAGATLLPDAPPVFILDAGRMAEGRLPLPGQFDNRWMVFPQDFPSGRLLQSRGIRRVLAIQRGAAIAEDLSRVLMGFRKSGMEVQVQEPDGESPPQDAVLARTSWMKNVLFRAMVLARLRRNSAGGFGARVPEPSQTGFFA